MLRFTLPLPPTLNATYKTGNGKFYKDAKAKVWEKEVGWIVKQKKPLEGVIKVEIDMYLKRDRDIDSSLKLILDTMAHCGVYNNDNQVAVLYVTKETDKDNPRMSVFVEEI